MRKSLLVLFFLFACQKPQQQSFASVEGKESKRLIVCSQNIARYGENSKGQEKQLYYLVKRISKAKCSIVALQEIVLKNPNAVVELAEELSKKTGRVFKSYVGKSRDHFIANGFLLAEDVGKLKGVQSFWNKSLPRINPYAPARNFARGPVLLELELAPQYRVGSKRYLDVFSIHFKSKRDGWKDPAKMNFEIDRIESAQAVREIALKQANDQTIVLVLGDRNNGKDKASDEVLEGKIELADLSAEGVCRLTKNEIALCKKNKNPSLIGLFGLRIDRFPGKYSAGSHLYRGKESLLDEAFIPPADLPLVTRSDNTLTIGYQGEYFKGSDHKLLYVELKSADVKERQ